MPGPHSFHVTVAADTADMLHGARRVRGDVALETRLKTEVAASHDEYHLDPSTGVPGNEIMARVKTRYRVVAEARIKAP